MPRRREPRPAPALELKTTRFAGIQVILNSAEYAVLNTHITTLFAATPDFFGGEAAVFECGRLPADAASPDWAWLAQELRSRGLNPFAVQNASPALAASAVQAGLLEDMGAHHQVRVPVPSGIGPVRADPAHDCRQVDDNTQSIAVQQRFITDQEDELRRVNQRFDDELARLRQLWPTVAR